MPIVIIVSLVGLFPLTAQAAGKKVRKLPGQKNLTVEKTINRDRKKIDFDSMTIDGQRRVPLGTLINQKQADKQYEFVKIRLRWRQEMIQSASNLNL